MPVKSLNFLDDQTRSHSKSFDKINLNSEPTNQKAIFNRNQLKRSKCKNGGLRVEVVWNCQTGLTRTISVRRFVSKEAWLGRIEVRIKIVQCKSDDLFNNDESIRVNQNLFERFQIDKNRLRLHLKGLCCICRPTRFVWIHVSICLLILAHYSPFFKKLTTIWMGEILARNVA
jgi:hypothetical protein